MSEVPRNKGIYLLPNLFTTAGLFAGFYSVVAAMKGHFELAAIVIFIAMIADGLDGRVARLTNTESAFGAQYDSLSDMLAFGVAPGLIIYSLNLIYFGKVGWLIAFFYTAAATLRLARFNIQEHDSRYFYGLPSPAAAGCLMGLVWFEKVNHFSGMAWNIASLVITLLVAVLMVSNVRFYSFKEFDLRGKVPFITVLAIVWVYMLIIIDPGRILFICFMAYALSGFVTTWFFKRKKSTDT